MTESALGAGHSFCIVSVTSVVCHRLEDKLRSFPDGSVVKNPPANAGDAGSIPGLARSLGRGNGNPFQYSCLENPMDRGAWWAVVHGVAELDATEHTHTICLSIFLIYGRLSEYSELLQDHYLLIF